MTTQELVERLREGLPYVVSATVWAESDALKAEAASRLSEMDAENKRLREALTNLMAHVGPAVLGNSDFSPSWRKAAREARAALEHQQKGEPKP